MAENSEKHLKTAEYDRGWRGMTADNGAQSRTIGDDGGTMGDDIMSSVLVFGSRLSGNVRK